MPPGRDVTNTFAGGAFRSVASTAVEKPIGTVGYWRIRVPRHFSDALLLRLLDFRRMGIAHDDVLYAGGRCPPHILCLLGEVKQSGYSNTTSE
jgi:hypothetical protein